MSYEYMNSPRASRSSGFTHNLQLHLENPDNRLDNLRQRTGPSHLNTIQIPKAMLTAPFLQYSVLTPGQKRYLCSMCEAYSEAYMRKLMQQHYLNVLHRSIRTGHFVNFITNTQARTSPPDLDHSSVQEEDRSDRKPHGHKDKRTSKKMTVLPKINSQQKSFSSRSPELTSRKPGLRLKKENHGLI